MGFIKDMIRSAGATIKLNLHYADVVINNVEFDQRVLEDAMKLQLDMLDRYVVEPTKWAADLVEMIKEGMSNRAYDVTTAAIRERRES